MTAQSEEPPRTTSERLPTLRLRISRAAETRIRGGHPWVFSDSVRERSREGKPGELAVVYDRNDRFLAVGLFDPDSPIQVRILHQGKPQAIDEAWFRGNLRRALDVRTGLFDSDTTGYRWINGESDGWPALVLDRYGSTCVLKLYSLTWLPRIDLLRSLLLEALAPERLVLRLSRNIQELSSRDFKRTDGEILFGPAVEVSPTFKEAGLEFEVDVIRGQKSGLFLDQRGNRRRVGELAAHRRVLNTFSFSGGFSLHAARGGAKAVTDLDISAHALTGARRNFLLNSRDLRIAACPHELVQADAFKWLARRPDREFDLLILDPPSLARRESERTGAIAAYNRLVADAVCWLADGGVLFAGSCSAHVTADQFFGAVLGAVRASGRRYAELERTGHTPDHPATFPEANYLKGIFLRF